jgi:hypothetical protein
VLKTYGQGALGLATLTFMRRILIISVTLIFTSGLLAQPSIAAVKAGAVCKKVGQIATSGGLKFTCVKNGKKLVWSKGSVINKVPSPATSPTPTPTPTAESVAPPNQQSTVILPTVNTKCTKIHEKIVGVNSYMKCMWQGGPRGEVSENIFWREFPILKVSTSKSNNYAVKPIENEICSNSGDTFDVSGGKLECRYIQGRKLQWIKINDTKKTFTNTKSPVAIDVCKLQNSASTADRTGRNSGAGLVGFPLVNSDKNGMFINGTNEVLIVPVDFPDFVGSGDLAKQLAFDKKWLVDWYRYFSNGKSKFNVTTIDKWVRMPKSRAAYPTDGKSTGAESNGLMGRQGQPFIDEISKLVDLRKFSTVYIFYPDGELTMNDLIVRNHRYQIKEGQHNLNLFSWGENLEAMETLKWSYYIHETLHDFNIIGHAPGNGWPLGMMTSQSGISLAMNPYEQFLLDWLPSDQIYCDDAKTLKTTRVMLSPVEREDKQTKMAIIKLSATRAIVVESHGIDKWSSLDFADRAFPPGFYSVMAYVVDLDKAAAPATNQDGTSLSSDDWAWAVWQKVQGGSSNGFNISVGDRRNLADYVAVLGDSFVIEGVRVKFVATGDFETIEISRA